MVGGREREWERSRVEGVSDVVDAFIGRGVGVGVFGDAFDAEEETSARDRLGLVGSSFATTAEEALDVACGSKAAARESNG